MANEFKSFSMSMFANVNDLNAAKAEYFEEVATRLLKELKEQADAHEAALAKLERNNALLHEAMDQMADKLDGALDN